jgi:hypothetical protein
VKEMKITGQHNYSNAWRRWRWPMPRVCRAPAA